MGAGRIIAIDNVSHRLELVASKYGAEVINFDESKDVVGAIKRLVGPDGLDKAIDATGFRYTKSMTQTVQRMLGIATDSSDMSVESPIRPYLKLTDHSVNECILSVRKFGTVALIADL
jgi:threonine dehydrogenase-like Zn-dependent dehydrogenase